MVAEGGKKGKKASEDAVQKAVAEIAALQAMGLPQIDDDNRHDPVTYARICDTIANAMNMGTVDALSAKRRIEVITDLCEQNTGMTIQDAAKARMSVIDRVTDLFEASPADLGELEQSFEEVDALRDADPRLKKKWRDIIKRILRLQREALTDHAKGMIYVMRDADEHRAGMVLHLRWFHIKAFDIWESKEHRNNLVMMPPGSGKTTCSRWQKCAELGEMPELRTLLIYDTRDKAKLEALTIKLIINSGRYHALYPGIRILGRAEGEEDSSLRFTVARKNWMAREPSIEVGGIFCNFNGQGYGRLWMDDPTPSDAREHAYVRNRVKDVYYGVLKRRLRVKSRSRISIICTPWHDEDLSGEIRKKVEQGRLTTWSVHVDEFAIRDDDAGNPIPIWPEKDAVEDLLEARFEDPGLYSCCFELRARCETMHPVKRLMFYNSTDRHTEIGNDRALQEALKTSERWLSIDPAGGTGKNNSDTGAVEVCLTLNRFAFFTDVWFHQKTAPEMLDWIVEMIVQRHHEKTPCRGVMIEAQGGIIGQVSMWQDLLPKRLEDEGVPRSAQPDIVAPGTRVGTLTMNRSKMRRLIEASPYINSGIVRFAGQRFHGGDIQKDSSHTSVTFIPGSKIERLRTQILSFDGSNKADAIDAVSQWILVNKDRLADYSLLKESLKGPAQAGAPRRFDPITDAFRKQMQEAMDQDRQAQTFEDEVGAIMTKYQRPGRRNVA